MPPIVAGKLHHSMHGILDIGALLRRLKQFDASQRIYRAHRRH
jgi:hypothetical protein